MQQSTENTVETDAPKRSGASKLIIFLPLVLFGILAAFFVIGLTNDKGARYVPSNLIGKPVPEFTLEAMDGISDANGKPMASFSSKDLKKGKISIVNVWSSWCVSCRYEHQFLQKLASKAGAPLYGLNYKDTASDGKGFLSRFGNPYHAIGMDRTGRVGIDFGVYGVPETFIIDGNGIIRYKLPGPVDDRVIEKDLLPAIEKARQAS